MPSFRLPRNVIARIANNIPEAIRAFEQLFDTLDLKQDTLISGANIKTINGDSVLGAGNLIVTVASIPWANVTGTPTTLAGYGITDAQPLSAVLSATTASFTLADEIKLDGIAAGAQVNVPTNLSYDAAARIIASDTGTDATLPLFTSTDAGLVPASGGGTANFLRADGTFAAPGGGGSALAGASFVTAPNDSYSHTQTIAAVGVTPAKVIILSLGAFADSDENATELLDIAAMSATPGTDQITVDLAFTTPTAGIVRLNWSAF